MLNQNQKLISQHNNIKLEILAKNEEIFILKDKLENALKDYQDEKKRRLELEISVVSLNQSRDEKVKELQIEKDIKADAWCLIKILKNLLCFH